MGTIPRNNFKGNLFLERKYFSEKKYFLGDAISDFSVVSSVAEGGHCTADGINVNSMSKLSQLSGRSDIDLTSDCHQFEVNLVYQCNVTTYTNDEMIQFTLVKRSTLIQPEIYADIKIDRGRLQVKSSQIRLRSEPLRET